MRLLRSPSPVNAEIAIGTSWMDSSRFWAETMISSMAGRAVSSPGEVDSSADVPQQSAAAIAAAMSVRALDPVSFMSIAPSPDPGRSRGSLVRPRIPACPWPPEGDQSNPQQ